MENNNIEKISFVMNCKICGDLTKEKCYSRTYASGNVGYYCIDCTRRKGKEKAEIYKKNKKEKQRNTSLEIVKKCHRHGDLKASQCYFKNHKNKKYEYYSCKTCTDNSSLRSKNKNREMLKKEDGFNKFFKIIDESFYASGLCFNKEKNKVFYE